MTTSVILLSGDYLGAMRRAKFFGFYVFVYIKMVNKCKNITYKYNVNLSARRAERFYIYIGYPPRPPRAGPAGGGGGRYGTVCPSFWLGPGGLTPLRLPIVMARPPGHPTPPLPIVMARPPGHPTPPLPIVMAQPPGHPTPRYGKP